MKGYLSPMRPKARRLAGWRRATQHCQQGVIFVCDGRSMPPAFTDHTTCPGLGLPITKCTQNTVMSCTSRKEDRPGTLVDQCCLAVDHRSATRFSYSSAPFTESVSFSKKFTGTVFFEDRLC